MKNILKRKSFSVGLLILIVVGALGLEAVIGQQLAAASPAWMDAFIFEESFESLTAIANNGGVYSGITIEAGKVGNAARIDNMDTLTYPSNIDPQKGTIRFWLKPSWVGNETREAHYFFDWQAGDVRMRIFTWYSSGSGKNYFVFRLKDSVGNDYEVSTSSAEPAVVMQWEANQWHEVIVFWDFTGADEFIGFSLDNLIVVNDDYDWTITDTPTTFSVGSETYGWNQADALIDELRIYDESIWDPDDIISSYKNIACGQGAWDPFETVQNCPEDAPILDPAIRPGQTYMFYETAPFTAVYEGTVPDAAAITDAIAYQAAQNEVEALFFNVYTRVDLQDVDVSVTDFVGPGGSILAQDAELRIVHNWWQAGTGPLKDDYPSYVPELLLYDDSIDLTGQVWDYDTLPSMPPLDHAETALDAHTSKQFALILPIPNGIAPGHYTATAAVTPANEAPQTLTLDLEVLPFTLQGIDKSILVYLTADIDHTGSQYYVSMDRYEAQLADLKHHGFNGATIYGKYWSDNIPLKLQKIKEAGLTDMAVIVDYYLNGVALLESNGYEPYFYGIDEPTRDHYAYMDDHITLSQSIHNGGGKVTTAITKRGEEMLKDCNDPIYNGFPPGTCEPLDMANLAVEASRDYLEELIDGVASKEDFETYYWQIMQEDPRVNRFQSGFFLWNTGLDGIFPYVYQDVRHNPYDDFDEWSSSHPYRDHLVTYPSQQGPVPTIQWEALREGLDDLRYLQTWLDYKTSVEATDPAKAQASAQVIADVLAHYDRYDKLTTTSLAQYAADRATIAQEIIKLQQAATGLGDLVWWDINDNGRQDAGEPGIPDVSLSLTDGVTQQATTDNNGVYNFAGLTPDTYTVTVDASNFAPGGVLENWAASPQDVGPDDADSDGDVSSHDVSVSLALNQVLSTIDFGFDIPSSYSITNHLNTPDPVRPGEPISFTIRITNTGDSWIDTLPLRDSYDTTYLTYDSGGELITSDSDDHVDDGVIDWTDALGGNPLQPGASIAINVAFTARADSRSLQDGETETAATVHNAQADPDGADGPLDALEPLDGQSASDGVKIINPTGLILSSFQALARRDHVLVRWQTVSELNVLGFKVLRQAEDGAFAAIDENLILAQHPGMDQGATYSFIDDQVLPGGRYTYRLDIVKSDGSIEIYGLSEVTTFGLRLSPPPVID